MRKRAASELKRESYGHLKSSKQKSTKDNKSQQRSRGRQSLKLGVPHLIHGALCPGGKILLRELDEPTHERGATRPTNSRVARLAT